MRSSNSTGNIGGIRSGGTGAAGVPRKMVIKPFKVAPKVKEGFSDEMWSKLKTALLAVYSKSSTLISKEELYRAVEDLCVQKMSARLYDQLVGELRVKISEKVQLLGEHMKSQAAGGIDSAVFLNTVDDVWRDHIDQLQTIRNIFLYLDRSYALPNTNAHHKSFATMGGMGGSIGNNSATHHSADNLLERGGATPSSSVKQIWLVGNELFRAQMDLTPGVLDRVIAGLLAVIEQYRRGYTIHSSNNSSSSSSSNSAHASNATSDGWSIIGRMTSMLVTLDKYYQFEYAFLKDSERFFEQEGRLLINELQTAHFLLLVEKRVKEAAMLSAQLLDDGTRKPLLETVEQCLLVPHLNPLIEKENGFKSLMEDDKIDDLKRMFLLFGRVKQETKLHQAWSIYCRQKGELIVGNVENQKNFVEEVLALQSKLERMLSRAFFSHEGFRSGLRSSFEHFLNTRTIPKQLSATTTTITITAGSSSSSNTMPSSRTVAAAVTEFNAASLIAKYVDKKLRGEKGVSEQEVENQLDQMMSLFRFLQEKDIFEAFYKKYLAKRLLLGKSASYELERGMLSRLKTECGSNYTSKLEGMFQDIELSRECQAAFNAHYRAQSHASVLNAPLTPSATVVAPTALTATAAGSSTPSPSAIASATASNGGGGAAGGGGSGGGGVEMQVQVLTTGYWPATAHTPNLLLPAELTTLMHEFEHFYSGKYQGRRLNWAHSLERCVLTARFPKGKKDLEVSLFQALVLKCFNRADRLSFLEIRDATGLDTEELKRTLQSVACGMLGTRVLTKDPKGKDVNDTDHFWFNSDFTNKFFRIKINTIQLKETSEEVEKTNEEVFRDREYQVDAAIVRTMKARKRLSHAQLISELLVQLRFPAQTSDLKKRIASLIERDYLERDSNDSSVYNYLA